MAGVRSTKTILRDNSSKTIFHFSFFQWIFSSRNVRFTSFQRPSELYVHKTFYKSLKSLAKSTDLTYLDGNVVVMRLGELNENRKHRQNGALDEKQTFWPNDHQREHKHQDSQHSQGPRTDPAFPVPLCEKICQQKTWHHEIINSGQVRLELGQIRKQTSRYKFKHKFQNKSTFSRKI